MYVTSIGQVVVCGLETDRLYKYKSDGQCLCHIQLVSDMKPMWITPLSAGDGYVISDRSHDQITWIREDGTTSLSVQQGEVKPGMKMGPPHELVHDNDGHILVIDYIWEQVLVFDQRGHCTGQLLSHQDGIRQPRRLFLDLQTDTIYVSCGDPIGDPAHVMIYFYSPIWPH